MMFGVMRMIDDALTRLRAEYLEMPGMRLTPPQVVRLCGIDGTVCQIVLDVLVREEFLYTTADGHYARSTDGHHPRPAKARLRTDASRMPRLASIARVA